MTLFARVDEAPVCTSDVLALVREEAAAARCVMNEFDSHSLRIGDVIDLYHLFGRADAERTIQKRGRWCSAIHQTKSRISATEMMSASACMLDANGVVWRHLKARICEMSALCHS